MQPDLNFDTAGIPHAHGSHTSWLAALALATQPGRRLWKTRRYLAFLYPHADGEIDHTAASIVGVPLSSINSIRNKCMDCGLVTRGQGTTTSPYGMPAQRWTLTEAGRAAVDTWHHETHEPSRELTMDDMRAELDRAMDEAIKRIVRT